MFVKKLPRTKSLQKQNLHNTNVKKGEGGGVVTNTKGQ